MKIISEISAFPPVPPVFLEMLQRHGNLKVDISHIHIGTHLKPLAEKGLIGLKGFCNALDSILFANHTVMFPDMFKNII